MENCWGERASFIDYGKSRRNDYNYYIYRVVTNRKVYICILFIKDMKKMLNRLVKNTTMLGLSAILVGAGCTMLDNPSQLVSTPRVSPVNQYLHLYINEKRTDNSISLNLDSFNISYDCSHLVYPYQDGGTTQYQIETYDNEGNKIGTYGLHSSFILFWDDFSVNENRGGIKQMNQGKTDCYIPYSDGLSDIFIVSRGKKIPLDIRLSDLEL